ncbi:hypothetical protein BAZOLSSOX_1358 [uncultured Gammaproteobacteria bacterium]|nr:hypothetical protein BAZOLSSOX_1358 [uncultured Gammaproteobacteria bacterium]
MVRNKVFLFLSMKVDWQKKGTPMSRVIFWYVKSSRDDPFAEVALDVVANKKFRGISANLFSTNNEQTGINLMVDYVDWVDADYADTNPNNWRGVLSNDQITTWHEYSFARTPGIRTYLGNSVFNGVFDWATPCLQCDQYTP